MKKLYMPKVDYDKVFSLGMWNSLSSTDFQNPNYVRVALVNLSDIKKRLVELVDKWERRARGNHYENRGAVASVEFARRLGLVEHFLEDLETIINELEG